MQRELGRFSLGLVSVQRELGRPVGSCVFAPSWVNPQTLNDP